MWSGLHGYIQSSQSPDFVAKSLSAEMVQDPWMRGSFGLTALFLLAAVGILVWRILPIVPAGRSIQLNYNVHYGVGSVGPLWMLFFPAIIGGVILLVNGACCAGVWRRDRALARTVALWTPVLALLLFLATVVLTLVNIAYV